MTLLGMAACARPNPTYDDAAEDSGSGGGSDPETSSAEVTSTSAGTEGMSASTAGPVTSEGSSDSDSGGSSSGGSGFTCVLDPKMECNLHGEEPFCTLESESCVPWAPQPDGDVVTTYCFPYGDVGLEGTCLAACVGEPGKTCGPGLLCDIADGEVFGVCHEPCGGTFEAPSCDTGLCYQFLPTGWQYGICRGDCNPTGPGKSCDGEQFCAVSTDAPAPMCVTEDDPGERGEPCDMRACAEGLICVGSDFLDGCDEGRCCADLCDPPTPCSDGSECLPVPDDFGRVDLGYCAL